MTDSEHTRMRNIVAEWIANARMGYGNDPDTLADSLAQNDIDLSPEWAEMEDE